MKKLLFVLMIFAVVLSAQFPEGSRTAFTSVKPVFVTVDLDSTDSAVIYVPFPTDDWERSTALIGETIPTATAPHLRKDILAQGDVGLQLILDSLATGVQESDSLAAYIKPLSFDPTKGWKTSKNDSTFLKFDEAGNFTASAIDYFDWTCNELYTVQLSNELWSFGGFALYLWQKAADNAGASNRIRAGFFFVR